MQTVNMVVLSVRERVPEPRLKARLGIPGCVGK